MKSINDQIYSKMVKENREYTNLEILKDFFKINSNDNELAGKIVEPILSQDTRFRQKPDSRWNAVKIDSIEELPIMEAPFILFYIDDIRSTGAAGQSDHEKLFSLIEKHSCTALYKGGKLDESISLKQALEQANRYLFVPHDHKSLGRLKKIYRMISPLRLEVKTLSVKSLLAQLYPDKKLDTWDAILREFSLVSLHSDRPSSKVRTLRHILEHALHRVQENGFHTTSQLLEFSQRGRKEVDLSSFGFDREYLKRIPEAPGVYLFYNREKQVLYAGKTTNLKNRINSYFWNTGESIEKIRGLLEQLYSIEYRILGSDLEALVEEYKLIDLHRPPFNSRMNIPRRVVRSSDKVYVLPSPAQGMMKLYFISDSAPLIEYNFDCSGKNPEVTDIIEKIQEGSDYIFDPLKVLVLMYTRRYEDYLNVVNIDMYSDNKEVLNVLYNYCRQQGRLEQEKVRYI
ncbi:MAG: nucleotide excision repair endonuclease [Spirochaetota bacterium]